MKNSAGVLAAGLLDSIYLHHSLDGDETSWTNGASGTSSSTT